MRYRYLLWAALLLAGMLFIPAIVAAQGVTAVEVMAAAEGKSRVAVAMAFLMIIVTSAVIVISVFIVNKRNKKIKELQKLVHAANNTAAVLLASGDETFEESFKKGIGYMAGCVGVDRVYIWKNEIVDGVLYYVNQYEWLGPSNQSELVVHPSMKYPYGNHGWEEGGFRRGEFVNGPVSSLSPHEQDMLGPYGIKSILAIPIHMHGLFWGLATFDDCYNERTFTENEVNALRNVSLMMVNAINRSEMVQDIRAAAAKLEAVISNYSGVIWSVDKNNIITLFNGLYLKEIGVTPSFLEGKSLDIAREKNRHLDIIENVQKTFLDGPQDWISEIEGKRFRVRTMPIYDDKGRVISVVGSVDDLTEIIRLQEKLADALKEAQEASQAKGAFLSNISHEIRTPMNAIIGMTKIGKAAADKERMLYAFDRIDGASDHLLGVINNVLDMSKIEAAKFDLSYEEFHFEEMLLNVVNVISFRVEEKRQKFTVSVDRKIPPNLIGDDQRLSQVITNLLSNAVKFTPEEKSIRLDARLITEVDGVCTLEISIADTGIGISAEHQAHIFESFQQAESSTSRKFGGTGLGLAISRHIVELMGGRIWVKSELGVGAVFAFTIQVKRGAKERSLLPPGLDLAGIRVLAVDDKQEALDCFIDIAEQLEIACDTAGGSAEALQMLDNNAYDICFIEWAMPDLGGIELARQITARKADKPILVLFSQADWSEIARDAEAAGVARFLPKPFLKSTVAECIGKCLATSTVLPAEAESAEEVSYHGYRLLLVEDIEINREIVIAMLEPTLLEIDCAEDGAEAVRMFGENSDRYDLIFMDVQMPEMDGYEATRRIRALNAANAARIPIIAMTANVFREDIEKCLAAGMNDHIGKPLDFNQVLEKLRFYLPPRIKHGVAWNDNLKLGDEHVDAQHKRLFELVSGLVHSCEDEADTKQLQETLDFLVEYTVQHFHDEETLQLQCRYPEYERHKQLHEDFKVIVGGLVREFAQNASSTELCSNVNKIVVRWLVNHILREDKKIGEHIWNINYHRA